MNLLQQIHAWMQRRRRVSDMYAALNTLDTRTLRDLGLDRSEILSVAHESAGLTPPHRRSPFQSASFRNLI